MDLTNIATIKSLLKKYGIYPSRKLGQNFLVNKEVLDDMVNTIFHDSCFVIPDSIIEIGSGFGTLTQELCQRAKQVIAVEKDPKMCEMLRETCGEYENLTIVNEDILNFISNLRSQISKPQLKTQNFKIIGNIPYSITSPLIRKLLVDSVIHDSLFVIRDIVLMVQKEVAERICAPAGDSARGFLSVFVQYHAKPEIIRIVLPEDFWPQPKVESAILKIQNPKSTVSAMPDLPASRPAPGCGRRGRREVQNYNPKFEEDFFRLVKIGFSSRRKQLVNNLASGLRISKLESTNMLKRVGISPLARAQDLSIDTWKRLFNLIVTFLLQRKNDDQSTSL